jgi:LuxR family maltose regulon positive regulatory protein
LLAVLDSRRHRLRGQLDAAEHALAAAPDGDRLPRWVREQVVTERVRLALARGDADALRPLDALGGSSPRISVVRATAAAHGVASGPAAVPEAVGTGVSPVVAIEAQLVRADLLAAEGHTEAAVAVLAEALRSAGDDGLRRPFLDAPPTARRLLRTHRDLAAARRWLGSTHPSPAPAGPPQPGVLSDREREALALLAAGLSTAGIAAAMGTSTNTARTHLRSIQRKLSATDRSDAVGRAAAPPEAAS